MNTPIPIFVINLERNKERKKLIKQELYNHNLMYNTTFVDGVDGSKLTDTQIKNNTTSFFNLFGVKNVIGCGLSHLKVWKIIRNLGIPNALILEDDAKLTYNKDNFVHKINQIIDNTPDDFDIINLGLKHVSLNVKNNVNNFIYKPRVYAGFQGYIISNKGANKGINSIMELYTHIDVQVEFDRKLIVYASVEKLISQDAADSNLADTFPTTLNRLLYFKEPFGDLYVNYYVSVPLYQVSGFPINFFIFIYILIGFFFKKIKVNILYFIIPFNILEINHQPLKIFISNILMILGFLLG